MMVVVDIVLLTLVVATAYAVTRMRSLFGATMMSSIYSLLMAAVWYNMHAMDVAFTEAAVPALGSSPLSLGGEPGAVGQAVRCVSLMACLVSVADDDLGRVPRQIKRLQIVREDHVVR